MVKWRPFCSKRLRNTNTTNFCSDRPPAEVRISRGTKGPLEFWFSYFSLKLCSIFFSINLSTFNFYTVCPFVIWILHFNCTLQSAFCKLPSSNFDPQTTIYKLQSANLDMQTAICKLQFVNYNLQTAICKLQYAICNANCKLQFANCNTHTAICKLQTAKCK